MIMILTVSIKVIVAVAPSNFRVKRGEKIKYDPCYNNHVINGDKCNDN